MRSLDLENEWDFIISEVHREKPTKENVFKRELLFTLQIILSSLANQKQVFVYEKTKDIYLNS